MSIRTITMLIAAGLISSTLIGCGGGGPTAEPQPVGDQGTIEPPGPGGQEYTHED